MPCGEKERRLALPVCVLAAEWESQWYFRQANDPFPQATFSFALPSLAPDRKRVSQVLPQSPFQFLDLCGVGTLGLVRTAPTGTRSGRCPRTISGRNISSGYEFKGVKR